LSIWLEERVCCCKLYRLFIRGEFLGHALIHYSINNFVLIECCGFPCWKWWPTLTLNPLLQWMVCPHHFNSQNSTRLEHGRNWERVTNDQVNVLKPFTPSTCYGYDSTSNTSYIIFGKVKIFLLKKLQRTKFCEQIFKNCERNK